MADREELVKKVYDAVCVDEEIGDYYDDIEGAMEKSVEIAIECLDNWGLLKEAS